MNSIDVLLAGWKEAGFLLFCDVNVKRFTGVEPKRA
jgi:hypothetical protein